MLDDKSSKSHDVLSRDFTIISAILAVNRKQQLVCLFFTSGHLPRCF